MNSRSRKMLQGFLSIQRPRNSKSKTPSLHVLCVGFRRFGNSKQWTKSKPIRATYVSTIPSYFRERLPQFAWNFASRPVNTKMGMYHQWISWKVNFSWKALPTPIRSILFNFQLQVVFVNPGTSLSTPANTSLLCLQPAKSGASPLYPKSTETLYLLR